jgi:ABC-type transporter Mla subunit MlaD
MATLVRLLVCGCCLLGVTGCITSPSSSTLAGPSPVTSPSVDPRITALNAFAGRFTATEATIRSAVATFDKVVAEGDAATIRDAAVTAAAQIEQADTGLQSQPTPPGLDESLHRLFANDKELSDGLRAISDHKLFYNQAVRDVIVQAIALRNSTEGDVRARLDEMLHPKIPSPSPSSSPTPP